MKKHSTKILAAKSQIHAANTDEFLSGQLVHSFEQGEPAAFQCFLWHQLALAEHSFGSLATENGPSELLTERVVTALFNKLKSRVLSSEFGGWVRKTSAEVAVEHLREVFGARNPEDMGLSERV